MPARARAVDGGGLLSKDLAGMGAKDPQIAAVAPAGRHPRDLPPEGSPADPRPTARLRKERPFDDSPAGWWFRACGPDLSPMSPAATNLSLRRRPARVTPQPLTILLR